MLLLTQPICTVFFLDTFFQAETELQKVNSDIETGKLYFTGTGYTVNLIPHAIILGLLTFGRNLLALETFRSNLQKISEMMKLM